MIIKPLLKKQKSGTLGSLTSIHLAVVLFGFSGLFGKLLTCTPLVIVFGRTFFAALALLPLVLASGMNPFRIKPQRLKVYILQGGLLAFHWCTFFLSIQISTVALGLLTFSTFPLFATLLEPFFFRTSLKAKDVRVALLVFVGLILVLPSFDFSQKPVQGALWGTMSGFTFALLAIFNKKNLAFEPPVTLAFFQNLFAAAAILPIFAIIPQGIPAPKEIALIATLGIIFTALAHTMFISSLKNLRATTVSIITCLEPLYGIMLAALLLNEIPGLRMVAGGTIIIAASFFASFAVDK